MLLLVFEILNSNWPDRNKLINKIKKDILKNISRKHKSNLTDKERNALKTLMNDHSIIIRPADKGSGIVIMDTEDYIKKVNEDLSQNNTYQKQKKDPTTLINNKVTKIVKDMHKNGIIDDDLKKYMTPNLSRPGNVKANPKVHKEGHPIRTIISGINHPTEKMAEIAEHELDEWVGKLPTYVKDTTHFLQILDKIKSAIPPGYLMFTMDVKGLYPSIPKNEGLQACKQALEHRSSKTIPTDAVMTMIETVLSNNIFRFDNTNFIQIEGTAIGSRLGRNYACTYMGNWEKQLLENTDKTPMLFLRYVDDIFGIWGDTEETLHEFHKSANNIHSRIKVDLKYSHTEIDFLDVKIYNNNGSIETTIYEKPSDKHMYLHAKSDHPKTTKNAIAYGLGIRAKRICSKEKYYKQNRKKIVNNITRRGYRRKEVDKQLQKVDKLTREEVLRYKENNKQQNRIPLTVTYGNYLPNIQRIVHDRLNILHRSENMKTIFPEAPLTAYRRDANLQDILVHMKHRRIFAQTPTKCQKKCAICKYITQDITFNHHNTTYTFNTEINCKTSNLIYGIKCHRCEMILYVGETGTTIYERFQNHISSIKRKQDHPVSEHFNTPDHKLEHLTIICIEKIRKNDIHYRKIRESFWIAKLNTVEKGINKNYGVGDTARTM